MAGIDISVSGDGNRMILEVAGDLDLASTPRLDEAIAAVPGPDLVLDLRAVTFVDSMGLRTMLVAHGDRTIVLRAPSCYVRSLLEIAGLGDVFTIED